MPKVKTKKTLIKRIKITKRGKVLKKQNSNAHLKVKMSSSRKLRKKKVLTMNDKGHSKIFKKLLAKAGKRIS
ncbi:hypothetical protein A3A69_01465 [candidate division WWE3 bacterium RIFCSPLOWO2_01_FULL_37_15]|uniref:Large ribosomal subunit protein bL35 n=1 Tax=candidate division WWE3 bacterium RIFCSPLOWO2_01_FULL_37_15 TaxID=1802622 RepID=A0A1F4UYX9_UNCKA|nr:MAG: hypothetical protein A3A69_01465 [candidate division WWE3 bacterium RIFCSPLOWO2_01_FULL_37_15]